MSSDFIKIIKVKPQVYLTATAFPTLECVLWQRHSQHLSSPYGNDILNIKFIKFNLLLTKVSIQLIHLGTNKIKSN